MTDMFKCPKCGHDGEKTQTVKVTAWMEGEKVVQESVTQAQCPACGESFEMHRDKQGRES